MPTCGGFPGTCKYKALGIAYVLCNNYYWEGEDQRRKEVGVEVLTVVLLPAHGR